MAAQGGHEHAMCRKGPSLPLMLAPRPGRQHAPTAACIRHGPCSQAWRPPVPQLPVWQPPSRPPAFLSL